MHVPSSVTEESLRAIYIIYENGLEVITEHNGGICSRDFVSHMRHSPYELVRFHSQFMTLYPGDLISTGCPKGARIKAGDKVGCRIDRVGHVEARVTA
jgi:2-keto-4-pentenoate hydratase/2-oxohepta-3-ene-1,7-dioic acid hydratase in catechol pathway